MNTKKVMSGVSLIVAALCLTACHENPMSKHNTPQNVGFLVETASCAEHVMQLKTHKKGQYYSNCMEQNKSKINCEQLFSEMLKCSKNNPDYAELTQNDLTDQKMYAELAEDYQIKIFNTMDF